MTRDGIENNLAISPYTVTTFNVILYFSSMYHLNKWVEGYMKNRDAIAEHLSKRYGIPISADFLADILFYKKTETRGFLIESEGVKVWQPHLVLDGEIKIFQPSEMLSGYSMQKGQGK